MPDPADCRRAGGWGEMEGAGQPRGDSQRGLPVSATGPCVLPPSQPLCFPCSVTASKKAPARPTGVLCAGRPLPQNPLAFQPHGRRPSAPGFINTRGIPELGTWG